MTLKNILGVIIGFVVGSAINMGIVMAGSSLVPPPAGVDVMDPESIAASMHLFEPKHFVVPFLAHALGTLVAAALAYSIADMHRERAAWILGVLFLAGGIYASTVIPAPTWYLVLDIVVAYLPMAWLGMQLAKRLTGESAQGTS